MCVLCLEMGNGILLLLDFPAQFLELAIVAGLFVRNLFLSLTEELTCRTDDIGGPTGDSGGDSGERTFRSAGSIGSGIFHWIKDEIDLHFVFVAGVLLVTCTGSIALDRLSSP